MNYVPGILAAVAEGRTGDALELIDLHLGQSQSPTLALMRMAGVINLVREHPDLELAQIALAFQTPDA